MTHRVGSDRVGGQPPADGQEAHPERRPVVEAGIAGGESSAGAEIVARGPIAVRGPSLAAFEMKTTT